MQTLVHVLLPMQAGSRTCAWYCLLYIYIHIYIHIYIYNDIFGYTHIYIYIYIDIFIYVYFIIYIFLIYTHTYIYISRDIPTLQIEYCLSGSLGWLTAGIFVLKCDIYIYTPKFAVLMLNNDCSIAPHFGLNPGCWLHWAWIKRNLPEGLRELAKNRRLTWKKTHGIVNFSPPSLQKDTKTLSCGFNHFFHFSVPKNWMIPAQVWQNYEKMMDGRNYSTSQFHI